MTAEALAAARELAAAGVPVFLARPAGGRSWDPAGGTGGSGYWLPKAWEQSEPEPGVVDRWEPGHALGAVMGHLVDGLDIDPRNGGLESLGGIPVPVVHGVQETPSSGWHGLIAPLGVGSRDKVRPGVDVKGGRADGTGRGFLWIAPTVKLSKATGGLVAYRWSRVPDLAGLAGDTSGTALADLIQGLRAGEPAAARRPVASLDLGDGRAQRYLTAAVQGELQRVLDATTGHRNATLVRAAFSLGQLVAAGALDALAVSDALLAAAQATGLAEPEASRTIASGLSAGASTPRSVL